MSNKHFEIPAAQSTNEIRQVAKLIYISSAKYGEDWHSTLHSHTCTELFYVIGGAGQFRIADMIRTVYAGDLVIVNPGVEHTEISLSSSPLEYIVLGIEGLEYSAGEEQDSRYGIINFSVTGEEILLLLRGLLHEIQHRPPKYELICQDLLEILVIHLMRHSDFSMTLSAVSHRTNKECAVVRRYLDAHFKENITLDQLAAMAHVNKYHMVHSFTREYGISPINYLISRRIYESRYLLNNTDHSLAQISQMLGFSSPSYFSQRFKKLEGVTPMQYRKGIRPYEQCGEAYAL